MKQNKKNFYMKNCSNSSYLIKFNLNENPLHSIYVSSYKQDINHIKKTIISKNKSLWKLIITKTDCFFQKLWPSSIKLSLYLYFARWKQLITLSFWKGSGKKKRYLSQRHAIINFVFSKIMILIKSWLLLAKMIFSKKKLFNK